MVLEGDSLITVNDFKVWEIEPEQGGSLSTTQESNYSNLEDGEVNHVRGK